MRITQIVNAKSHWIFEADEIPNYPQDPSGGQILMVDITSKPEVMEGWDYDGGVFTAPVIVVPEPADPQPSTDEIIRANYLETQYQTVLLEMQSGM